MQFKQKLNQAKGHNNYQISISFTLLKHLNRCYFFHQNNKTTNHLVHKHFLYQFLSLTLPGQQSRLIRWCCVNRLPQGTNHVRVIVLDIMVGQRRGKLREPENLHCSLQTLQAWKVTKEIRNSLIASHLSLPAVLTSIRSHLLEGGGSAGADGSHSVIGRLVQVRQARSQPLAQSVVRAGVASVARL